MRTIEFIGPSGVGKSFLYHRLFEKQISKRPYMGLAEATIKAALCVDAKGRHGLMQLWLRQYFLNWKKVGIATKILRSARHGSAPADASSPDVSFQMMMARMMTEPSALTVQKRINNFLTKSTQLNTLDHYLSKDAAVIFDEGPIHHHHGLQPDLTALYAHEQICKDPILRPAGVVYCELSSEAVFLRALKRKTSGLLTYSHEYLNDDQLRSYVYRNVEENQDKRAFFEKTGIPVFAVNTQEDVDKNIGRIDFFIKSILSADA